MLQCPACSSLLSRCAAHLSSSFVQRIYNVALGAAMQRVLRKHRRQLFAGARQPTSSCAADACAKQDLAASSSPSPSCLCRIPPPDEVQTYRCWQLTSIDEYYNRWVPCCCIPGMARCCMPGMACCCMPGMACCCMPGMAFSSHSPGAQYRLWPWLGIMQYMLY